MKNNLKLILLSCFLLIVAVFAISCGKNTPFEDYDKEGYTVSVKYDANGGTFTTNTETIIDTYNPSAYTETNGWGDIELTLFAPDSPKRGDQAYTAFKDGYYLAGWYTERTEVKDATGKVTGYTYGNHWDFDTDRLSIDPSKSYTASSPVVTLYAAWIPTFTYDYEFYVFDENNVPQLYTTLSISPDAEKSLTLPRDNEESGRLKDPNGFPAITGKTYDKIYLSAEQTTEVTADTLTHPGRINYETLTVEDRVMKVYCTALEGVRYDISTVDQLIDGADVNGYYDLKGDLDFTGKTWPAVFNSGEFRGIILGNGHTIRNVSTTQNDVANASFGLFGKLASTAKVTDVTFDNITVKIRQFSKTQVTYGILAGEISDGAHLSGVQLKNSTLDIEKGLSLTVAVNANPKFGLVCAEGAITGVTFSPEDVTVTLSGSSSAEYLYTIDAEGRFSITKGN